MRSPTLLLIRMKAAETSASSAIADWTLLTVASRSLGHGRDRHVHDRGVHHEDEHRHRQKERQPAAGRRDSGLVCLRHPVPSSSAESRQSDEAVEDQGGPRVDDGTGPRVQSA